MDGKIDIIRPMHDLRGMPNNSVGAIYSSHTLEHTTYGDSMITKTLAGKRERILQVIFVKMIHIAYF